MQKTVITLIDDLDSTGQTLADETVPFALDGVAYEIDLSSENAHVLRARLKDFIQCGRAVKSSGKHASQPVTTTSGTSKTKDTRTTTIRAWAVEQGVMKAGQRGKVPTSVTQAYDAFQAHDSAPLNELRALRRALDFTPGTLRPASDPALRAANAVVTREAEPRPRRALRVPEPAAVEESEDSGPSAEDGDEAKAREHYTDLKEAGLLSDRASAEGYWERRTAGGLDRTDKVAKMTLVERIEILTPRNVTLLAKLAGLIAPDGPGKISYLKSSVERLENLEVIVQDPESPYGWSITDFGRYAHELHSMGE